MLASGATRFHEFGPGNILQKLIRNINADVAVGSASQTLAIARNETNRGRPPSTEAECHLRDLWASLLPGIEPSGIHVDDSFFLLGGDSLLAMRLSRLARQQGLTLSAADVLAFPQLSALANRVVKTTCTGNERVAPFGLLKRDCLKEYARMHAARLCQVDPEAIEDVMPCTPLQEGLLALTSRRRDSYVSRYVLQLAPTVDAERLKRSWETALESMPVLRSRIIDLPGQGLVNVVIKNGTRWCLSESTMRDISPDELENMGLGTALSTQAIIRKDNRVSLVWTVHHAAYDGWSMGMFLDHVKEVYAGGPMRKFAPFQTLIKHILENSAKMEEFWVRELHGLEAPQFPSLPTSSYQPRADDLVVHKIRGLLLMQADATAATIIRAAWSILSARYTDSEDVVFGATVIGRQAAVPDIESIAGPAIATVPIRVLLDPAMTVQRLLRKLQRQAAGMVAFEQLGLQNIARLNADAARACQFQTLLVVQPKGLDNLDTSGPELFQEAKVGKDDASRALKAFNNYACMIECLIEDKGLELRINFDTHILQSRQVERMAHQFENLIRLLCSASTSSASIGSLDLAGPSDLREIWTWNKAVPLSTEVVVHELIMHRATLQPNAPAVCAWDGDFTYQELDRTSTLLACHLLGLGVSRGSLVPLCFEKSKWTVVSMVAVMKAGGTSIAMDSTQPEERLRTIVNQAKPAILLSSRANSDLAARLYESAKTVVVEESLVRQLPGLAASALPTVDPADGLYVVFTSGSTGTPKGCMVSHASFSSAIRYQRDALRYSTATRLFDFVSYAFDVTWPNALQTLSAGGCLCVPSESERRNDISGAMQRLRVNAVHVPPSVARLIDPAVASSTRTVVLGGEAMTMTDRTRWGPGVEVIQVYGPAECTPPITAAYFDDEQADVTDIGRGFGVNLWLVHPEDHTKLAGVGMVGEILVEGPLVGQGYLSDPNKTAASFIEDPPWLVQGAPGASGRRGRLYKTGDLARYSTSARGTMLFIGRKDAQVKIRGQRVELGDVEHHVQRNIISTSRIQVVADKVTLKGSSNPILAVFVPLGGHTNDASSGRTALATATAGLNDRLASILPAYMIPSAYIPIAELPTTATGKTDRHHLRELGGSYTLEEVLELNATHPPGEGRAPLPGMEQQLQQLWAQVLGVNVDSIRAEHNFLRIGGDSIGAMRLVAAAGERGLSLSAADVFDTPILSDLAKVVKVAGEMPENHIVPFSLLGAGVDRDDARRAVAGQCSVKPEEIEDMYPCTPLQEGLLSETVKRPGAYTARKVFELPAATDLAQLENAIRQVTRDTPILRTHIVDLLNHSLFQVVIDNGVPCLYGHCLEEYLDGDCARPFGLQTPLTRFGLIHDRQVGMKFLVWTIHHALYDGWSRPLIMKQIELAYHSRPLQTLSPFQPFIKYVRELQNSRPEQFWEEYLHDLEAVVFPSLPSPTYQCRANDIRTHALLDLVWPSSGITASTLVRLAWAMVQSAWTNTSDIIFGVMTTGRQAPVPHIQRIAGPTIATVPVRILLDQNRPVSEMLQDIQSQSVEALAYEQTGLQNIRRFSSATKSACEFQTLLVVQPPQEPDETTLFRQASGQREQSLTDFNSYALMVECKIQTTGLIVEASFDSTVLGGIQIERILRQFATGLRSLCGDKSGKLRDIHVASEQDMLAVWAWNGKEHAPFQTQFPDLFARKTLEQRDAPAICAWDGKLSYGQLDNMTTAFAHSLANFGLGPGVIVGIYFEKSMWMPVAAVAVLKAGGAFVALDDGQPQQRLKTILSTAKASMLISSARNREPAARLATQLAIDPMVVVDRSSIEAVLANDCCVPLAKPMPSDPMIIQFTSGSTGTPKGAVLTYQNVSSFIHYLQDDLGYKKHLRVYDFASYAFDTAWANLVSTLSCGGCLCVPSRSERDRPPKSLRWIAFGGEMLTRDEAKPLAHVEAVNTYAPCECTCIGTVGPKLTTATADRTISSLGFGRGTNTWIVDPNHTDRLAPVGAIGELWLEGPLVGAGYVGDAERTAATWVEDPPWLLRGSSTHKGRRARLYRTGDLVQYNEDGSLAFKGRKDAQVKLRGQRIELEEVRHHVLANINDDRSVRLDAEIFTPKGSKAPLLAVFVAVGTSACSSHGKTQEYLKRVFEGVDVRLSQKIPSYMIPSAYIPVAEMPLTVTAKTNRLKLRALGSSLTMEQIAGLNPWRKQQRPPTTALERQLQRLWAAVLDVNESSIGADDNFLHIGGDSIAAMRLVGAARKHGLHFTVAQIFKTPQLCTLAASLADKYEEETNIKPLSLLPDVLDKDDVLKRAAALCNVPELNVEDIYPCTPLQEGMLALTAKDAARKAYVARNVYELRPTTDLVRFRRAWDQLYAFTPILRTRIVDLGKAGLAQVVLRQEVQWRVSKPNGIESGNDMGLGTALSRCEIVLSPEAAQPRFYWFIHHALYDGWTFPLMRERLEKLYSGEQLSPSPSLQPFIRHVLACGDGEALHFWKSHLQGSTAQPFPALPSPGYQPLPREELSQWMQRLDWPSDTGITQSTYIQAAWAVLSACYTNCDEAIFGITVSGRSSPVQGIEEMLGPTIATVPFRALLDRDDTVSALLRRIQSQSVAAIPFAQTGLNRIRRISPEVESASQFQTLLLVNVASNRANKNRPHALFKQEINDASSESLQRDASAFSTFAMTVQCDVSPEDISIHISFDSAVMLSEQVDRIGLQFQHILRQLCLPESEASSKRLSAINVVSETDLTDIWAWNKLAPPPVDMCVHELIGQWVQKQPSAPAICAWDGGLTYKELDSLSTRLACYFIQHGLGGPGQIIPLSFDKSMWAVVAILGVMKSGGASVLFDVFQPPERLRAIFQRVEANLLLCSPAHESAIRHIADVTVLAVDEKFLQRLNPSQDICLPQVRPSDLLYVSFTSGSTGQPKGVVVHHTHFSSAIKYQQESLGYEPGSSRVYDFASYSFDISWSNMLQALGSGACLCIPSEAGRKNDIAGSFNALGANMIDLTPSISRTLSAESMPGLKTLIFGGEAVRREDVLRWSGEGRRLIVAYGPAETTPTSTVAEFSTGQSPHNIGFGVGCCSWVVDPIREELTLVGGVGELWTEGPIVCAGYLGEPEKTAAAFVHDPPWLLRGAGAGRPGRRGRLYKTGDLVRFNLDGSLDFIGRKDDQVKIRGQRIELTEIELTIERCLSDGSKARQVLVEKILPKDSQNPMLAAFLPVGSAAADGPTDSAVKVMQDLAGGLEERLAELLPGYMLPGVYIPVHRIPITTSGKKDRKKLRDIGGSLSLEQLSRMHIAPRQGRQPATEVEKQFQHLFAQVLGIKAETVGADDSFLRIGGDSITAMRLAVAAREMRFTLSVADVLRHPHLGALAEQAAASVTTTPNSSIASRPAPRDINVSQDNPNLEPSCGSPIALPVTDFQCLCIAAALKQPPEWWNAFYIALPATLNRRKVVESCRRLWNRFDVLRTVFLHSENRYLQMTSSQPDPDITVLETSGNLDEFSHRVREEDLRNPLVLGKPFARFILTYDTEGHGQLTFRLSHALYDGISLGHLMQAFAAFLQDQLLPPSPSFASFIRLAANSGDRGHEYWRSLLRGSSITRLPPSRVGGEGIVSLRRDFPLIRPQESVTAATIFTAACAEALSTVTKQRDVVFGRLVSGRSSHLLAASDVVGPCINFVPVRVRFNGATSIDGESGRLETAISSVEDQFVKSLPHENVGLAEIVSFCTDWRCESGSWGGSGDSLGFGITVQYETHDGDPRVEVLGKVLTLRWHSKRAEALYDGCVAVAARREEGDLSVSVSGSESRLGAMRNLLDRLWTIIEQFPRVGSS
ncbi:putative non-ribosomal peptide synthase [Macrophomina phaseolina]|uniref:Non-ribosomal peptide synthase n=1 Tax=Macrophomina phaseolina TaxID=35725 RepID=A0ABQ8G5J7_9PEZI|nr:putative non-ribosomal peptide synthase [Macrophomina phaseolina]